MNKRKGGTLKNVSLFERSIMLKKIYKYGNKIKNHSKSSKEYIEKRYTKLIQKGYSSEQAQSVGWTKRSMPTGNYDTILICRIINVFTTMIINMSFLR